MESPIPNPPSRALASPPIEPPSNGAAGGLECQDVHDIELVLFALDRLGMGSRWMPLNGTLYVEAVA